MMKLRKMALLLASVLIITSCGNTGNNVSDTTGVTVQETTGTEVSTQETDELEETVEPPVINESVPAQDEVQTTEATQEESIPVSDEKPEETDAVVSQEEIPNPIVETPDEDLIPVTETSASVETIPTPQSDENKKEDDTGIPAEHLNSFSMMYYLAITAEEIRTSRNNRLILDEIYTSLLNDINPGAVDEVTQDHLKNLRDIIKDYRGITVKRERLQYIYNQDKAAAIRSAVPNPVAILSMANSLDWKRLAASVVYAAVDSYVNYKNASENADKAFLMSGWELDDEETAAIQKNRDRAFDYMVDMLQEYQLEDLGLLTLNEKDIERFAEICAIEAVPEKTRRLVSEEDTYRWLGNYWLELADCYFETNKYEKCLECVNKYNSLATGIYRKDHNYVQILPKAIVAAQSVYSGEQYISMTKEYADAIIRNTTTEDWSTRYFVAQVYLDLYSRTKDKAYLESAYKIAYDNVTILLKGQRELNGTYLKEVQEVKAEEPDYKYLTESEKKEREQEYKEEKKRVKAYNEALKKARITELPSLYEPLVLNCELLFALSDELNISETEKADIEAILKTGSNGTFLTKPINDAFSFSQISNKYSISFNKDDIKIPADLLTEQSKITITIKDKEQTVVIDDCVIKKVVRDGNTIDSFMAYYTSKKLKKLKWSPDAKITLEIKYEDANNRVIVFNFKVTEYQEHWYGDKVEFGEE